MKLYRCEREIYRIFSRFCKKTKAAEAMTDHVQCNLRGQILHPCDPIRFLASLGRKFFDSLTRLAPSQARRIRPVLSLVTPLPSPPSFSPPTHPLGPPPPPLFKAASANHPPDPPFGDLVAPRFLYGRCRGKRDHVFLCGLESCILCDNGNVISVMLRA